jgi:hypothetical protein
MIQYVGASARAMAGFEHVADPRKVARIVLAVAELDTRRCGCSSAAMPASTVARR